MRGRRALRIGLRVVAICAALVLVAAGLGYWWLQTRAVNRADVINPAAPETTSAENILLVGLDTRTDAHGQPLPPDLLAGLHAGASADGGDNTDTIMVVHIPAGGGRASAISIPRDTYVPIADGYGTHKITSAYTYGANTARSALAAAGVTGAPANLQAAAAGARTTIATVSALIGVPITHYAAVNLAAFEAISTAIGGVPVCLNSPVDDPNSGAQFPAGPQTVQGPSALAFVRQRDGLPGGDLDRIRRQQAFLASASHTVLSAGTLTNPAKLAGLISAVQDNITLDQGWNLLGFAQSLSTLHPGAIDFSTIPIVTAALVTPNDGVAVGIDPTAVRAFVAAVFNPPAGGPPTGTRPASAPPTGNALSPSPWLAAATSDPAGPAPSTEPLITADGVTCVN